MGVNGCLPPSLTAAGTSVFIRVPIDPRLIWKVPLSKCKKWTGTDVTKVKSEVNTYLVCRYALDKSLPVEVIIITIYSNCFQNGCYFVDGTPFSYDSQMKTLFCVLSSFSRMILFNFCSRFFYYWMLIMTCRLHIPLFLAVWCLRIHAIFTIRFESALCYASFLWCILVVYFFRFFSILYTHRIR